MNEVDVDYYEESFQNETINENPYLNIDVGMTQRNPLVTTDLDLP